LDGLHDEGDRVTVTVGQATGFEVGDNGRGVRAGVGTLLVATGLKKTGDRIILVGAREVGLLLRTKVDVGEIDGRANKFALPLSGVFDTAEVDKTVG
jgi:hypothetical protein